MHALVGLGWDAFPSYRDLSDQLIREVKSNGIR